jgi:hypothetical protein
VSVQMQAVPSVQAEFGLVLPGQSFGGRDISAHVAVHKKRKFGATDADELMTFQIRSECSYTCSETFKFFVAL